MDFEMLAGLPAAQRQIVLDGCTTRRFSRGELIIREGDVGSEFFLIEAGRVALKVTTPGGEVMTLSILSPGQGFGEMALVGGRRTASGVAIEPTITRVMSNDSFDALRREHPAVDRLLIEILAARVDRLSHQLTEALYLPVEVRLARRLLALAAVYRRAPGPVTLPLTQEDIAGIVGTSRPTANQILKRLAADGIVELTRGAVHVRDDSALRQIASGS